MESCLNVASSCGFVRVPTMGSSTVPTVVEVSRKKYYSSQSAKSLTNDFCELNSFTKLDPAEFAAGQRIQFARGVCLEVPLASFGEIDDLFLKVKLVGGKSEDVEKASGMSSFPGRARTVTSKSVASLCIRCSRLVSLWKVSG